MRHKSSFYPESRAVVNVAVTKVPLRLTTIHHVTVISEKTEYKRKNKLWEITPLFTSECTTHGSNKNKYLAVLHKTMNQFYLFKRLNSVHAQSRTFNILDTSLAASGSDLVRFTSKINITKRKIAPDKTTVG